MNLHDLAWCSQRYVFHHDVTTTFRKLTLRRLKQKCVTIAHPFNDVSAALFEACAFNFKLNPHIITIYPLLAIYFKDEINAILFFARIGYWLSLDDLLFLVLVWMRCSWSTSPNTWKCKKEKFTISCINYKSSPIFNSKEVVNQSLNIIFRDVFVGMWCLSVLCQKLWHPILAPSNVFTLGYRSECRSVGLQ